MTKEEIKNLRDIIDLMLDKCILADSRTKVFKRLEEVCDLAIKALEQDSCCDAISREAVLSMKYRIDDSAILSTRDVVNVDDIEDLPPVIPQQKVGHWIKRPNGFKCSKCLIVHKYHSIYCPSCGARMTESLESEE